MLSSSYLRKEEHQNHSDPYKSGEKQEQEDGCTRKNEGLQWNGGKIRIQSQFSPRSVLTCSPPRSKVRIKEQARDAGNPIKESIRSLSGLLFI